MSGSAEGQPELGASALWSLARPNGMPLVLGLPLAGWGYAHWEWGLPLRGPREAALVLAAWWFLSAGTLWANAALDRDEEPVLMGPARAVAVPPWILAPALGALGVAVALAAAAGPWPFGCAGICAALAVAYSHPATAWKGHPALGPATNLLGYGFLSPAAGFAVTGAPPTARTWLTAALLVVWVGGAYLVAQAYQEEQDRARGYRTLVVTHGPAQVIRLARAAFAVAVGGLTLGALGGLYPIAAVVGVVPAWLVDRRLAAWRGKGVAGARDVLRGATILALVVLVAVTAQHLAQLVSGLPPAGLGTPWSPR